MLFVVVWGPVCAGYWPASPTHSFIGLSRNIHPISLTAAGRPSHSASLVQTRLPETGRLPRAFFCPQMTPNAADKRPALEEASDARADAGGAESASPGLSAGSRRVSGGARLRRVTRVGGTLAEGILGEIGAIYTLVSAQVAVWSVNTAPPGGRRGARCGDWDTLQACW